MLRNPMISAKALFPFCHAMSRMLEAGVDIRKALETSAKSSWDQRLVSSVQDVSQRVRSGFDLTTAFEKHSQHYPKRPHRLSKSSKTRAHNSDAVFLFTR